MRACISEFQVPSAVTSIRGFDPHSVQLAMTIEMLMVGGFDFRVNRNTPFCPNNPGVGERP
jgi:hypothetical protein